MPAVPPRSRTGDRRKYCYSLTMRTHRRTRAFVSPWVVGRTLDHFLRCAARQRFAVLAYCFMPDHVHLLVEPLDAAADVAVFVNRAMQGSGYAHRRSCGQPLWQDGYRSRLLRSDVDTRRDARRLLENPVRAGLARDPRRYPHCGSAVWSIDELLDRP